LTVKDIANKHGEEIKRTQMGRTSLQTWLQDKYPNVGFSKHFARMVLRQIYREGDPGEVEKMQGGTSQNCTPPSDKNAPPQAEKTHPPKWKNRTQNSTAISGRTEQELRDRFNVDDDWIPVRMWGSAEKPLVKWERDSGNVNPNEIIEKIDGTPKQEIKWNRHAPQEAIGVLSIRDAHFGMATMHPDPYENYSVSEAAVAFVNAGAYLIDKAKRENVKHLVIPFGSDTLHVDGATSATTKGTPQETIGYWWEAFEGAMNSLISVVELAREVIGEVTLVLEQGNHDHNLARALGIALTGRWSDVTVLISPNSIKRVSYGNTHLFFHHGNDVKQEAYLVMIGNTYPDSLSKDNYIEILTGHYHHRNKTILNGSGDYWESGRLNYRITPALCPSSNWAEASGYNSEPGAQLTVYDNQSFLSLHEWKPRFVKLRPVGPVRKRKV
jgi:hypothetical protein